METNTNLLDPHRNSIPVADFLVQAKQLGFSDQELANLFSLSKTGLRFWTAQLDYFYDGELYDCAAYITRLHLALMDRHNKKESAINSWLNSPSIANNQFSPKEFMLDGGIIAVQLIVWDLEKAP